MYDLGFVRYPEFVAADALDYPELLRRAVRRGAWIHTTSDFVRDEVDRRRSRCRPSASCASTPASRPIEGGDAARGRRARGRRSLRARSSAPSSPARTYPALVRAFDAARRPTIPSVVLVVAGHPRLGRRRVRRRARAPRTTATGCARPGYVSADDRRDLLAGASVLAYPSHYEGFGFPPLEAMAAGVPVVATRAGAVPEVVGDAALLVDPDDVDALAGALATVLHRRRRRAATSSRAAARATARFSWTAGRRRARSTLYRPACAGA